MRSSRGPVLALSLLLSLCAGCGRSSSDGPTFAARTTRVRVGAVELNTVQLGAVDGRVRVVLHGGPGLDHSYLRLGLDGLASSSARLVYVDLRGHGRSDAPPDAAGYTLSAAAGDVAALIGRLSDRAPVDVIAHDFGAAVALELAATHPARVRKLVLIAPVRDGQQIRAMGERSREVLGEQGARALAALSTPQGTLRDPRQLSTLFRTLGPMWWARTPPQATLDELARGVRYRPQADEHFLVELLSWDGRRVAREVRAETLVISGSADKTFTPAESRALADTLAHGRFVEIAEAGHLPFVERRVECARAIADFLR